MSLLMANQALVRIFIQSLYLLNISSHFVLKASSGKVIYDPFIGTGSMAYVSTRCAFAHLSPVLSSNFARQTTAHFGAQVFGSDIDGRQMRGKSKLSLFVH